MKTNFGIAKSSNIYETFSPLYKALKFFGIISFDLRSGTGKVSVNHLDFMWMVVCWLFWTCLIICNLYFGAREREPVDCSISFLSWNWLLTFQLIASFYIQLVNLLKRKSIGKLFQILSEIDGMVRMILARNS